MRKKRVGRIEACLLSDYAERDILFYRGDGGRATFNNESFDLGSSDARKFFLYAIKNSSLGDFAYRDAKEAKNISAAGYPQIKQKCPDIDKLIERPRTGRYRLKEQYRKRTPRKGGV